MEFPVNVMQYSQDDLLYVLRGHRLYFPKNIFFLSLKINFALANSVVPIERLHHVAFHLALHCLTKYPFRGFWSIKG